MRPVGQDGTDIGFAAFNGWFHELTGVHMTIYIITDWLGLVPLFILILSILVDTFISKISLPMQPVPEIGSISVA